MRLIWLLYGEEEVKDFFRGEPEGTEVAKSYMGVSKFIETAIKSFTSLLSSDCYLCAE